MSMYVSVAAWKQSDAKAEDFPVKEQASSTIENFYDAPIVGCRADIFQIISGSELCWGGYVIIGVSIAVLVLIAIVIGVSLFISYYPSQFICIPNYLLYMITIIYFCLRFNHQKYKWELCFFW